MKKTVFVILIATMLIAACSTPTPTLPALAVNPQASAVSQPTKLISKEFTPSNPKNVKLNAGKPQLVEFFAFW
ncbi:MAG: hypothetical protein HZB17_14205 [Chloroflexi bacterium]|nr:hypothetical protein [Chloroflexota bacterium]